MKSIYEDKIAYDSYLNTVEVEDNIYLVRLPFKPNSSELHIDYSQSLGQLYSFRSCHNITQEHVSRKFIEVLPDDKVHIICHIMAWLRILQLLS